MSRSPIWYLAGLLALLSGLIPTAKNLFELNLFKDSQVVIIMMLVFIFFISSVALITRKQFIKNL